MLVKRIVRRWPSSSESTEVGRVDADEAENDGGSADLDAIDAMVKREA